MEDKYSFLQSFSLAVFNFFLYDFLTFISPITLHPFFSRFDIIGLQNQIEESNKTVNDNINSLTTQISNLAITIANNNKSVTEKSITLHQDIEATLQQQKADQENSTEVLRKEFNENIDQCLQEQREYMDKAIQSFHLQIMATFPSNHNKKSSPDDVTLTLRKQGNHSDTALGFHLGDSDMPDFESRTSLELASQGVLLNDLNTTLEE